MSDLRLKLWEGSEEYKAELAKEEKRFQNIGKSLGGRANLGFLRFDQNGFPQTYLSENLPIHADAFKGNSEDARRYAGFGTNGWWRLDELEKLVVGSGVIFETAMWEFGFRRHKRDSRKWARISKRERRTTCPAKRKLWEEEHVKEYMRLNENERERLKAMLVMPNESAGLSKTYSITVGKTGLIYVELWANPFAGTTTETLYQFSEQQINRAHIARQQEGYEIKASNVKLWDRKHGEGVYIQAIRFDRTYEELVWPSVTPNATIVNLLNSLPDKLKRR